MKYKYYNTANYLRNILNPRHVGMLGAPVADIRRHDCGMPLVMG